MKSTRALNPWTAEVHAHMLETGESLTVAEITARFGEPDTGSCAAYRMGNARRNNWFTSEPTGAQNRAVRYKAQPHALVKPSSTAHRGPVIERNRPFARFGRDGICVRSVFELGAAL